MATRKKKTKKKATTRKAPSIMTDVSLQVRKGDRVDGGRKYIYKLELKNGKDKIPAGSVIASSEAEARKKGKRIMRALAR